MKGAQLLVNTTILIGLAQREYYKIVVSQLIKKYTGTGLWMAR